MDYPSQQPQPWWQSNLAAGAIGGTISTVAGALLIGVGSKAFTILQVLPAWGVWALAVIFVVAALVAVPLTRRLLRGGWTWVWRQRPVRHLRLARAEQLAFDLTQMSVQADVAHRKTERDAALESDRLRHEAVISETNHGRELKKQVDESKRRGSTLHSSEDCTKTAQVAQTTVIPVVFW